MSDYLAIIPARSGSVGLKNKNKLKFDNKPLIFWSIESALKSKFLNKIIVTSNDKEILNYKNNFKSDKIYFHKRPNKISANNSKIYDVIKDSINSQGKGFKKFILLQPTSPLRNYKHINEAITIFEKTKALSCISISKIKKSIESFYQIKKNNYLKLNSNSNSNSNKLNTNRQLLRNYYEINGAIYISYIDNYLKNKTFKNNKSACYLMDRRYSVDIDDINDFNIAEYFKKLK